MSINVEPGRDMAEAREDKLHANNREIEDRLLPETSSKKVADELLPEKKEAEHMTNCKRNSNLDKTQDKNIEYKEPNKEIQSSEVHQPFLYEMKDTLVVFLCMTDDYIMKCPMCQRETKHIIRHISQS